MCVCVCVFWKKNLVGTCDAFKRSWRRALFFLKNAHQTSAKMNRFILVGSKQVFVCLSFPNFNFPLDWLNNWGGRNQSSSAQDPINTARWIFFSHSVVFASICYRTTANQLINESNMAEVRRKIWTGWELDQFFFLWSSRIRVDRLLHESKTTDKRGQYHRRA